MSRRGLAPLLALAAACQPQARRLLLLDLNLTDPITLDATAEPWADAGYSVEYRRFYPHITRQDLTRYRVIMLLGGREPEAVSDVIDQGDLALLTQWVPRGGVLVLGYAGDGEGFGDRWTMNRWLAAVGAGITIGDYVLRDTVHAPPSATPGAAIQRAELEAFPSGRAHVLLARDPVQAVARAAPTAYVEPAGQPPRPRPTAAVVAADRVGDGLVVVASRHTLGVLGPEFRPPPADARAGPDGAGGSTAAARARRFLIALARWTRRPAEWALLPPARRGAPVTVLGAPRPVPARPPRLAPPDGVTLLRLPERHAAVESPSTAPSWMRRQGMRILELQAPPRSTVAIDSLLAFLEAGAINGLWYDVTPGAADSIARAPVPRPSTRAGARGGGEFRTFVDRLQETSVSWFPGVSLQSLSPRPDSVERGLGGDSLAAPCALDQRLWTEGLGAAFSALARLAAARPDLVAGITLDLEGADGAAYAMGAGFCDATYAAGLRALGRDSAWTARFLALPVAERFDSLLAGGLLGAYYEGLENVVAGRAAALRATVTRARPGALFALRTAAPPADWFTLGVLRGLSSAAAPVLLWTNDLRVGDLSPAYRARGINVIHAPGLDLQRLRLRDWPRLAPIVFERNDGFWLSAVPGDSVARLIRRMSKER